ncbi:MAG TPA: DUF6056 family protein [Polyangiaceae bacterium]|nr:DUF6056 family protein [Polyangiaceae bacterium]
MIQFRIWKALSVLVSIGLLACIFYISFIAPPSGDTWGYVMEGRKLSNVIQAPLRYFNHDYFHGNPRIGQIALRVAGQSPFTNALVTSLSVTLVIVAGIVVGTGRVLNPLRLADTALAVLFFGVLCRAGKQVGQALFYIPYTANYVFGFGVLLALLAVCRLGSTGPAQSLPRLSSVLLLGFFAGMSNEHTPPFVFAAAVCAAAMIRLGWLPGVIRRLHVVAFVGLVLGYLALFFAPGQTVRYGGSKNSGFSALLNHFPAQLKKVSTLLFDNSVPFFLAALALLVLVVYLDVIVDKKRPRLQPNTAWALFLLVGAVGFAAPLLASPKLGQRIFFASYASLGLAIAALLNCLYERRAWRPLHVAAVLLALVLSTSYLHQGVTVYRKFATAFARQSALVMVQKAKGKNRLKIAKYKFNFRKAREYVRAETFSKSRTKRLNRLRAQYYGVRSFSYK